MSKMYKNKSMLKRSLYIIICSIFIFNFMLASTAKAYKKITAHDLRDYLSVSTLMIIIDVRNPEDYSNGRIPTSVNMPLYNLSNEVKSYNIAHPTKIIVYANTQEVSDRAAKTLEDLGYTDISSMGSINGWTYSLQK